MQATEAENTPSDSRWQRWAVHCGWVAAFVVPLWIATSRLLVGTAGWHTWIYALTLAPLLLVLAMMTLAVPARRGFTTSGRACAWLWIAFGFGAALGFVLPDAGEGATAVISVWFGEGFEGTAVAASNTAAIVMGFSAVFATVFAFLDSRTGGPIRTTDEDEAQGSGYYPLLGE